MRVVPKNIANKLHDYGWYPGMSANDFYNKVQPTVQEAWNWAINNNVFTIEAIQAIPEPGCNDYYCHIVLDNGRCFDVPFGSMASEEAMEAALYYIFENDLVNNRTTYF